MGYIKLDIRENYIGWGSEIDNEEQLVQFLTHGIDLLVADHIKSKRNLTENENIERATKFKNDLLEKIKSSSLTCQERYIEKDLIEYEP